jgi:PAS domain S-box-containing protein
MGTLVGAIETLEDVTERKNAEEALISANRQLNDIIEFLPDATLVIDKDEKVIAWNRAIEEMTGISKEEMIGKGDRAYSVPFFGDRQPNLLIDARDEDLESRYQHVWRKGGIQYGATYDPSVYGGKGAYLFATGAPLYDAHGNRVGAIESIRDVTEQKKAEEALRQSEEKYRELVENANSIILRMDYMGHVTFFNEFAQGFFGYSEEEIMGKNVVGTIVPPVESTTGRDLRLMVEDIAVNPERYASNINENMRRGGERVWIAWTNKPIRSENGRVMETLCVGNDITERKQAEEELKHSEERFKVFFECAPDPYYLIDLQGNFLDANKAAEEAIGYKREELIGKNLFEANLLLPEDIPMAREQFARNILGYPSGPDEFVLNRKDGKQVFLEIRAFPTVIREQHLVLCIARDITRRKQIEETLRDRETRLRAITDSARDAILMMDPEGMITYWNPAAERILGYTREETSGQNLHRLIAPQRYHAAHHAGFSRFVETGLGEATGKTLELVARRKDGEEIPVELSLSSVFMNGWQAVGLLRDITERKQADEALKRANLLLFTQNETSIDGIMAVDENDTIISSNQRFADMWGISREVVEAQVNALVLRSVSDKVMDPQAFLQRVGYLDAHRNETSLEEIALKDGRTFERYSAPMNGTDGRYYGRVSYFRDITERKLMGEAVAEAEAKYRGIFENALMGIFQSTPEGRLLSLNMAFARILGYDCPEEVLNSLSDISRQIYVNPDRRSELLRLIEEKEMVQDFEVQFFKKDKSSAWITLNMRAVRDANGKIIHMDGIAEDITESKRLASQLNQAQKMEAIGTLAGGIAHDFNNILMPIIGYSELSLNAVPQGSRLHHNIEQVLLSGNRARDLVKQILTFSRKREQERRPVQVSLLVKETLKLLRSSLPSTIEIRKDIDAGAIDGTTMADPTQIHQVLMNLCTNAAHAMGNKGGVLSINLQDVDIDSAAISGLSDLAPGSYLRLSIADTGHGMDEAVKQRIFDPYFTTKGPSKGTGLGLSLVYGIITSLSGGIAVFSVPGQGTTFDVYFPRTKTLQAPMVEVLEPLPTGKGLILVVDDEQSIVDMLKQMLESLGYDVAARYSSSDALQAFGSRANSFDLVISDMTMPNMTGIVLAREILKIRPDTPIILCTGFSEGVDENRAKLLGIKEFLMKPVALRDLATTVKKILFQGKPIT